MNAIEEISKIVDINKGIYDPYLELKKSNTWFGKDVNKIDVNFVSKFFLNIDYTPEEKKLFKKNKKEKKKNMKHVLSSSDSDSDVSKNVNSKQRKSSSDSESSI